MTNLIAKVAELKELDKIPEFAQNWEVEIDGRTFSDGSQVAHIKLPGKGKVIVAYTMPLDVANAIVNLRNAALGLLAALGKVHAKDSEILDLFVAFMERFKPDGHLNDIGPGAKITNAKAAACLRRYADLARMMEGNP